MMQAHCSKVTAVVESWSDENELKLLSAILDCGFGNWKDISVQVPPFSPEDCQLYYYEKFVNKPEREALKLVAEKNFGRGEEYNGCCDKCRLGPIVREYRERFPSDPEFGGKGGRATASLCSAFNPLRSDWDVEPDDQAEQLLVMLREPMDADLQQQDDQVHTMLVLAVLEAYNFKLMERMRRKRVVRQHALLDRTRAHCSLMYYENILGKSVVYSLSRLLQLTTGPEMDLLLERLKYQIELIAKINKLISYRCEGLTKLGSSELYESLYRKRVKYKKELGSNSPAALSFDRVRRPPAPLSIHGLPGYHRLEQDEKDLCSSCRIVPETFLSFRQLFLDECIKNNGLKLAQARPLVKIDVNKTRKMYDFLLAKGVIWLPKKKS